ncbi:prepilin peptidase [Methanobrevibacter wolinii]|uniref:prepilin peptidase n=1 Tax=Methanobrevibacter wolinii TaxID=190977 RepID=UPI0005B2974B|nr:prepilin peptidase [Methanobrevibacter wolinii]
MDLFIIPVIVVLIATIIASYTDIQYNIISNKLNLILIILGIVLSLFFTIFYRNPYFISSSLISGISIFIISYILWILGLWAGGDVKLLTGIAFMIPSNYYKLSNFWPFTLDLIINSLLIAFPFIFIYISIFKLRSNNDNLFNKIKYEILSFNIFNSTNRFSTYLVPINNLKKGMILDKTNFNSKEAYDFILNNLDDLNNLYLKKFNEEYIIKSQSSAGLNYKDIKLLKELKNKDLIKPNVFIKIGIPFAPIICIGYIITLFYGNLIISII